MSIIYSICSFSEHPIAYVIRQGNKVVMMMLLMIIVVMMTILQVKERIVH